VKNLAIEYNSCVNLTPCHFERSAAEELALSEAEGGVEWEKSGLDALLTLP